jgi:hypothetical protein
MKLTRKPLRSIGVRAMRWQDWHRINRAKVLARCTGHCEGCRKYGVALDWHHVADRSHLIGEPWASTPELTVALCKTCHHGVTYGTRKDLDEALKVRAFSRLAITYDPFFVPDDGSDGLESIRQLVDHLERVGWAWNGRAISKEGP